MPRPSGAPFFGESRACDWDFHILAGVSDYWDADAGAFVLDADAALGFAGDYGEGLGGFYDNYLRAHEDYSGVMMSYVGDTYLEDTDDVSDLKVTWVIRAKGDGTLSCWDDYDPTWAYSLPANALDDIVVSGASFQDYEIDASAFTIDQLMSSDAGAIRFGFVVSGTDAVVDIDVVYLRIWPTTGALGGWQLQPTETRDRQAAITEAGFGVDVGESSSDEEFDFPDDSGAGFTDAWDSMLLDAAGSKTEFGVSRVGWGVMESTVETSVISSLDGSQHLGKFQHSTSYLVVDVDADLLTPADFLGDGEDGVDYIRRPDRHQNDLMAYFSYATPGATPFVIGWTNDDLRVVGSKSVIEPLTPWPVGDDADGVSVNLDAYPYAAPPSGGRTSPIVFPLPVGDDVVEVADVSDGITSPTDTTIPLGLPYDVPLMLSLGNTGTVHLPPQSDLEGLSIQGEPSVSITATAYLAQSGSGNPKLTALIQFPPHRSWNPYAAPVASWVRQVQRNDGLGLSNWRWRSYVTVNARVVGVSFESGGKSIRWRAIR